MLEIIPGINETEWSEIERKIELVLPFAKTIHVDLEDGFFVNRKTFFDPAPFAKYTDKALFELHMIVENPLQYLKPWADVGFKRFLGHIEHMRNQEEFLQAARQYGEAGLAIDGPTDLSNLKVLAASVGTLLFMSIKAGFSGQEFNSDYLSKIQEAKEKGFGGIYEVDGGINDMTIVKAKEKGATRFVSTSHLFNSLNIKEEFKRLTFLMNEMGAGRA